MTQLARKMPNDTPVDLCFTAVLRRKSSIITLGARLWRSHGANRGLTSHNLRSSLVAADQRCRAYDSTQWFPRSSTRPAAVLESTGRAGATDRQMVEANGAIPPVAVVVRRGERVESEHRVAYAVADAAGRLLEAAGDVDRRGLPALRDQAAAGACSGRERRRRPLRAQRAGARPRLRLPFGRAGARRPGAGVARAPRARRIGARMRRPSAAACGRLPSAWLPRARSPERSAQQLLRQARRHDHRRAPPRRADRRLQPRRITRCSA